MAALSFWPFEVTSGAVHDAAAMIEPYPVSPPFTPVKASTRPRPGDRTDDVKTVGKALGQLSRSWRRNERQRWWKDGRTALSQTDTS